MEREAGKVEPFTKKVRISVNIWEEDFELLDQIARARRTNRTEALRGALATEKMLLDQSTVGKIYFKNGDILSEVVLKR